MSRKDDLTSSLLEQVNRWLYDRGNYYQWYALPTFAICHPEDGRLLQAVLRERPEQFHGLAESLTVICTPSIMEGVVKLAVGADTLPAE